MSTSMSKRRRVRKACTPCHQRKRKCDNRLPCGMCTAYEYDCFYGDAAGRHHQSPALHSGPDERPTRTGRAPSSRRSPQETTGTSHGTTITTADGTTGTSNGTTTITTPDDGIFDEYKSRYAGASAAMAFPHVLGVALGSTSPPRMRSFAYNFGIRPEEAPHSHGSLSRLIDTSELARFSAVFFTVMAPVADLVDRHVYARRCQDYYLHGSCPNAVAFGAVAAGVAALGSFLSATRHPREPELVRYAKAVLDDPLAMRALTVDHIVALALRVFYLRATTRPNAAWVASCTVLHLCEAVGLHREANVVKMAATPAARATGHDDADRLRRIFWVAYAGHRILSYEYDRSAVSCGAVTCGEVRAKEGSVADQFVKLGQVLPGPADGEAATATTEDLCARIRALDGLAFQHPFIVVTKADLAFCFYRRLYQRKTGIPEEILGLVIRSGNAAIVAAEQLAGEGRMFWNVIGSVFQYTCVLLAMDTAAAHGHVARAFASLATLVRAADTALTRETLAVARRLLRLSAARKRGELERLEAVEASYEDSPPQLELLVDVEAEGNWEMDWDQFLVEPYLTMFGLDATL